MPKAGVAIAWPCSQANRRQHYRGADEAPGPAPLAADPVDQRDADQRTGNDEQERGDQREGGRRQAEPLRDQRRPEQDARVDHDIEQQPQQCGTENGTRAWRENTARHSPPVASGGLPIWRRRWAHDVGRARGVAGEAAEIARGLRHPCGADTAPISRARSRRRAPGASAGRADAQRARAARRTALRRQHRRPHHAEAEADLLASVAPVACSAMMVGDST